MIKREANRDRVVGATLLAIVLIYALLGRDLPWLVKGRPAAGFFPLIITVLLAASALSMLIRPGTEVVKIPPRGELVLLGRACGIVAICVLVMPYCGFLVATFLLLALAWLPVDDTISKGARLLLAIVISLIAYAIFSLLLNVQLPKSVLGF